MSSSAAGSGGLTRDRVLTAVADRRRRHVVRLLVDARSPLSVEDLAIHLATLESGKPLSEVTEREFRARRTDLAQMLLPMLEDVGLVSWDREEETVRTTDHPAYEDPTFQRVVDPETGDWDAVLANLAHGRRRIVLWVLKDEAVPMTVTELARAVVSHESERDESERDESDRHSDIERVTASLHHVHLPKLSEAGLVAYDIDDGTTSYEGHPDLDDSLFDLRTRDGSKSIVAGAE